MNPNKLCTQTEGLSDADTLQAIEKRVGAPTVVRCPKSMFDDDPEWCVVTSDGKHFPFDNEISARDLASRGDSAAKEFFDRPPCCHPNKIFWETDGPRLIATIGCMVVGMVQHVGNGEWAAQNLIEPDVPRLGYFPLEQAIEAVQDAVARELAVAR